MEGRRSAVHRTEVDTRGTEAAWAGSEAAWAGTEAVPGGIISLSIKKLA